MITLKDGYSIDVGGLNYTVRIDSGKTDKKGNKLYITVGYGSDLAGALDIARRDMIKKALSDGVYSLREALEVCKKYNEEFKQMIEEETLC